MTAMSTHRHWICGPMLAITTLLTACGGGGTTTVLPPPAAATGTVTGTVLNAETGAAVQAATISSGSQTVTSNGSGAFTLNGVTPATRVLLRIRAASYAEHLQVIQVSANQTTRVSTQLVPVAISQPVVISTGGSVDVPSSPGLVTVPGNALNGSGTATVNVTPINTSLNPALLPGDFSDSTTGAPVETFGALTVTASDGAGNPVPVAALITIRIPVSTRSGALLSTLPLYYLDPDTGRWILSSFNATLDPTSAYYEGQVDKAGTWSVNAPFEAVSVAGCVQDQLGARVAGVRVTADGIDYSGLTSSTTDSTGNFSVAIKKSAQAVLTARSEGKTSNSLRVGPSAVDIPASGACLVLTDQSQNVTVKLTWGEAPLDVDGHLVTPNGVQVYFDAQGSLSATPWANLDVDDLTSFGPEVITVRKLMVGTYRYYVNNFSGTFGPGVTESPTRVELNVGGLSTTFAPPPNEATNTWWSVFTFTVDALCGITVTPVNTWSSAAPVVAPGAETYCSAP